MLNAREREIAIQAIAARATGTPSEAAIEILEGIEALDRVSGPIVLWPKEYMPYEGRATWLEAQAAEYHKKIEEDAALWATRGARKEPSHESQDAQSLVSVSPEPAQAAESESALGEEVEATAPHPGTEPARGASDASQ